MRAHRPSRHTEHHSSASQSVRDVALGAADGLTVPFALAAGLAGAGAGSHIVVTAGFAEIAAGAIAMGLGGFLAARSDSDHYYSELRREREEVKLLPEHEAAEVVEILESYGLDTAEAGKVVQGLRRNPERWVDFMMRFELGLEAPQGSRAITSALTIGGAYFAAGLIPLTPYMLISKISLALEVSAVAALVSLGVFGAIKGRLTGVSAWRASLETTVIGGCAALVAYAVAGWVSG